MRFRPCIDIHNGKVKQIVGGSLTDKANPRVSARNDGKKPENADFSQWHHLNDDDSDLISDKYDRATENFVSTRPASWYARLYRQDRLSGGHVIMLNKTDSPFFQETKAQALEALKAFPGGMQVGGGITPENAAEYLEAGASHVIVTSFLFEGGRLMLDRLKSLRDAVGANRITIDLSCVRDGDIYYVASNRWQHITDEIVNPELFIKLSQYCDEFLIHGVDVEGKRHGIDTGLIEILSRAAKRNPGHLTYAGGITTMDDVRKIALYSSERLDFTVGSALDLFGGDLPYSELKLKEHFEE
jgi:phosphoribosylformimino-5-aminoimidazole carboxamide ribotide isomerase